MLNNSKHQGNTMTYHLIHVRMAITKQNKTPQIRNVGKVKKGRKKMKHFCPGGGYYLVEPLWKTV